MFASRYYADRYFPVRYFAPIGATSVEEEEISYGNNYWNFKLPWVNQQYGTDWDDFLDIINENIDYIVQKIVSLYWLNDITRTPLIPIEYLMRSLAMEIDAGDTLAQKKYEIRKYNPVAKNKGTGDLYLDYAENIVGTRGVIYNGLDFGSFVWDLDSWPDSGDPTDEDWIWSTEYTKYEIYIDVKTTDSDELDEIQELYRQSHLLPAFYQIYLIDSSFNVLRTI